MKLLVDTHALIWSIDADQNLSPAARVALADPANNLAISAATLWEIAIKWGSGKLVLSRPYRDWITQAVADLDLEILPITVDYCERQAGLPRHHGDPFDRLLVAQALTDGLPVVSADAALDPYGVVRLW